MELFEKIDRLHSNDIQKYDISFMFRAWIANPYHRSLFLPPYMNELFELLDEELLIGEKPTNTWRLDELRVSGICGALLGSGDYYSGRMV